MRLSFITVAAIMITLLLSCEKNELERSWLFIEETHCSNAWDDLDYNTTEDKVKKYLKNNGISMHDFKAEVYSNGPFCEACTCPSGRNIRVFIDDKDKNALKQLGFEE